MENKFDEMRAAVNDARRTIAAADSVAADMGSLLVGRLKHCRIRDLVNLKKELKNFNIHTGRWKL